MKYNSLVLAIALLSLTSCNRDKFDHDASGMFEATEVIVSAEGAGTIEEFNVTEGDVLVKGQMIGYIDSTQLYLKKLQLQKTTRAVSTRKLDVNTQIAAIKAQISKAESDKQRVDNMFKDGAATQQMVDDVNSQLSVLRRNLAAQVNSISTSTNSLNAESSAYDIQVAQVEDQLRKCRIVNPINGTVLNKYSEAQEVASIGKPLYKIANTKHLYLRAYIVATQLEKVRLGQAATVFINTSNDKQKSYEGKISWISGKAEFTPKTIQTQDERQNLVYAVKISVDNTDGLIKIGMYGDVDFK